MSEENTALPQDIPDSNAAVRVEIGLGAEGASSGKEAQQVVHIDSGEPISCGIGLVDQMLDGQSQAWPNNVEQGDASSDSDDDSDDSSEVAAWPEDEIPALLEALLFASVEPLSVAKLSQVAGLHEAVVQSALTNLEDEICSAKRGIELVRVAGKYQLRTRARFGAAVAYLREVKPKRLSNAALETLSIIAYKQPVVKSEIDKIRGVDSLPTLKTLLDRHLVKIVGYQPTVGQPALYGTTEEFLAIFGLNGLPELPAMRDVRELEKDPGEVASD